MGGSASGTAGSIDTATAPGALNPAGAPTQLSSAGGGAAAPASGTGSALSGAGSTLSGLGSKLLSNPSALVAGGGLLAQLLGGNKQPAFESQIAGQAAQDQQQAAQLESYLTSGTLPPGMSAGLQQAHAAAAATIRSQYAARGQSGSTAESQDLANLASTTMAQGAQIATQLLNQGVQLSEFSSQLYEALMNESINQDNQFSQSIANFAGALGGFRPTGTASTALTTSTGTS